MSIDDFQSRFNLLQNGPKNRHLWSDLIIIRKVSLSLEYANGYA